MTELGWRLVSTSASYRPTNSNKARQKYVDAIRATTRRCAERLLLLAELNQLTVDLRIHSCWLLLTWRFVTLLRIVTTIRTNNKLLYNNLRVKINLKIQISTVALKYGAKYKFLTFSNMISIYNSSLIVSHIRSPTTSRSITYWYCNKL